MAIKYAIANGAFESGSTWNDGTVPVQGDTIYANGHTVTINADIHLPGSTLDNGECPDTGTTGGQFQYTIRNFTIEADIHCGGALYCVNYSSTSVAGGIINITGDISGDTFAAIHHYNGGILNVNGTVRELGVAWYGNNITVYVTGSVIVSTNAAFVREIGGQFSTVIITGSAIYGIFPGYVRTVITGTGKITGNYIVDESLTTGGTFAINNGGTLDISESEAGVFPILGSFTFDNITVVYNYPQESDVRAGVEYGYGKVGQLVPVAGVVVNLNEDQINRVANSLTAEMAQTMLQQYFG